MRKLDKVGNRMDSHASWQLTDTHREIFSYKQNKQTKKQKRKKKKEGDIVYVNLIENFYKNLFYFYF